MKLKVRHILGSIYIGGVSVNAMSSVYMNAYVINTYQSVNFIFTILYYICSRHVNIGTPGLNRPLHHAIYQEQTL